ncbi:MerR family transcriptional regulator [Hahella sp. HN01]|uniref:MerR family transcriptional regulator n=1 Tax=unclassified Hahella TaxID=2624107 RepID=UPI001C1EC0C2|nr:MerR family transcriptional regulator [Hahella sp. HN01]MBU6955384.1 MerR family transcriptional regulator [Hahella sp. HN01]
MYIGKLAKLTGTTPKAIRHYETLGLLPEPQRREKYRVYSDDDVEAVTLIKQAQALGFKLSELKKLVAGINVSDGFPFDAAIAMVKMKRQTLHEEMQAMQSLDKRLRQLQEDLQNSSCRC